MQGHSTNIENKIYIGSGDYDDSDTPFYVDGLGKFSLGEQLK